MPVPCKKCCPKKTLMSTPVAYCGVTHAALSEKDHLNVRENCFHFTGRQEIKKKLLQKFKRKCCVCGNKSELTVCYNSCIGCYNCKRFYKEFQRTAESGSFVRPNCLGNGESLWYLCKSNLSASKTDLKL